MGGRFVSVILASRLLLTSGCTAVLYPGPERPDAETAVLSAGETSVDTVDGRDVRSGRIARYRLLPGPHAIEVNLDKQYFGPTYVVTSTSRPSKLCFVAKAGKSYRTHPIIDGRRWHPTIIDEDNERAVEIRCPAYVTWSAYSGPHRTNQDFAIVEPAGLVMLDVDGGPILESLRVEVLPGARRLSFGLWDADPPGSSRPRFDKHPTPVCVTVEAGHSYLAVPAYDGGAWRPRLIDRAAARPIASPEASRSNPDCLPMAGATTR